VMWVVDGDSSWLWLYWWMVCLSGLMVKWWCWPA